MKWLERRRERKLDAIYGAPHHFDEGTIVFVNGIVNCWGTTDHVSAIGDRLWLVWCGPRQTPLWISVKGLSDDAPYWYKQPRLEVVTP